MPSIWRSVATSRRTLNPGWDLAELVFLRLWNNTMEILIGQFIQSDLKTLFTCFIAFRRSQSQDQRLHSKILNLLSPV